MRPRRMTDAHRTDGLAELVCSNSFRSDDAANNAVGLLHAEMRRLGSLIMRAADANQVPAGGALAVDRDGFSAAVTKALNEQPLIEIHSAEIDGLPMEVLAGPGREPLGHGPKKPFGLTNPHDPTVKPHAIVQLRQDNKLGTLYNMVGFQTKLKHGAQQRVFRTIPGLEKAEFARLGGLHRNTFLNSPKLLDSQLRLRAQPRLRFAGQMTGCEGYVESASIGLIAGLCAAAHGRARSRSPTASRRALGWLLAHSE